MSEEQLKAFLEKVKGDISLQEKLEAAANSDVVAEIAKEAGFTITAEDIQLMQSATGEVSDEELQGAAGGDCSVSMTSNLLLTVRHGCLFR